MSIPPAASLTLFAPPEALLNDLLAVSLTGIIVYTPMYDAAGTITDFTFEYLNPVAQRMMSMPERPTLTHNQQWPHSIEHGTFAFHVDAFVTGEPRRYDINYQADGYDNYYCLAARRSGNCLLVSFTDTADQPRTAVEIALRESQAAEKKGRQQMEQLNQELESRVQERTEQLKLINEALGLTNQKLSRTNTDLDNFIYIASHDLKAPITNIEGLLDLLHHQLPAPLMAGETGHILTLMHDSVNRFKRTIEHLADVNKLQRESEPATEAVDLARVIDDVCLDLAPQLAKIGGTVEVDVNHCPPLLISAKNLRSVVANLLGNALKYHQPGRPLRVQVHARAKEGFVVLDVQDNGLGIELNAQREAQIFAMFQRLHSHVEGSGLGLYMVKRIAENAGGTVTVQSQLGKGTLFSVALPTGPAPAGPQ
ncbi:sensor histidine kinase [Hymenobacter persicinus]|uniref:histidine kinase n=1 Tax=Hymenobacter persicinus TaxID=2025506 RepID=A0A4Q5L959_9BACT|nr:HAMP domain-containing sensor histidine kinase [Hymenobacter persicinus]RYU76395.1 HAMP domain-containing histidine kinase [Hymenobacter persicinus]